MSISTSATHALDLLSIPYRIFEHPHPPELLELAASERGQDLSQVVRSILFRYKKDKFFLTLIAGPEQISWRSLRTHLGVSRISMATEEEVLSESGYAVGTVTPLGLAHPVRVLADFNVFTPQEISLGSGILGIAIIMKPDDLKRAIVNIEVGQFC